MSCWVKTVLMSCLVRFVVTFSVHVMLGDVVVNFYVYVMLGEVCGLLLCFNVMLGEDCG